MARYQPRYTKGERMRIGAEVCALIGADCVEMRGQRIYVRYAPAKRQAVHVASVIAAIQGKVTPWTGPARNPCYDMLLLHGLLVEVREESANGRDQRPGPQGA